MKESLDSPFARRTKIKKVILLHRIAYFKNNCTVKKIFGEYMRIILGLKTTAVNKHLEINGFTSISFIYYSQNRKKKSENNWLYIAFPTENPTVMHAVYSNKCLQD